MSSFYEEEPQSCLPRNMHALFLITVYKLYALLKLKTKIYVHYRESKTDKNRPLIWAGWLWKGLKRINIGSNEGMKESIKCWNYILTLKNRRKTLMNQIKLRRKVCLFIQYSQVLVPFSAQETRSFLLIIIIHNLKYPYWNAYFIYSWQQILKVKIFQSHKP